MKKLCLVAVLAALPAVAMADNVGQCGWGSKLMAGQAGVVPQVAAVTTNGTFGNQTFGITTGTSGCTQDGTVSSNWRTSLFIDGNKENLARDMSIGNGESLDSLAHLIGVESQDRAAFNRVAKENMARIFPSQDVGTPQIAAALREVLANDAQLSRYSTAL
jgi:opacity protein-like surface antigen